MECLNDPEEWDVLGLLPLFTQPVDMVKRNNIAGFLDITQQVLSVRTHVFHSITFPAVVADVLLKDWWTLNRKGSKPQHRNEQPPLFILFFGSIVRNMFEVFALQNFYPLRPFPWPWHRLHMTTYRNQINHPFGHSVFKVLRVYAHEFGIPCWMSSQFLLKVTCCLHANACNFNNMKLCSPRFSFNCHVQTVHSTIQPLRP